MAKRRKWTVEQRRTALLFALIGVPVLAISAKATAIAYGAGQVAAPVPDPPAIGFESEDHFPGGQLFYVADDTAAPALGTTGTIDIATLRVPLKRDGASESYGTVRPALPFSMSGARALDRARALECLATAIYYEAASQSDDGQRAVAQVILNRVRHPAFPSSVCGVVYQGSERSTGCQFSFACDGSMVRRRSNAAMMRAMRIAAAALNGHVMKGVGLATHYHTYAVTPSWNRGLVMTDAIGVHFFHRWKGYWGTNAAFSNARYEGREPLPRPHTSFLWPPLPQTSASVFDGQPSSDKPHPQPSRQLTPPGGELRRAAPTPPALRDDNLPNESPVLERWRDSGKPLR